MKRQTIVALTVIIALLAAAMLAGCVEKEVAAPIDNQAFKNTCADAFDGTADQLEKVQKALESYNFIGAEFELATFETLVDTYISDIEQTTVSEEALPFKNKILAFLNEMKLASTSCNEFFDTNNENDLKAFYKHIASAMAHGSIAAQLAEDL